MGLLNNLLTRIPDILIIVLGAVALGLVELKMSTWERPFRLDDPDISYDLYSGDIVPAVDVIYAAVIFPIGFIALWCSLWFVWRKRNRLNPSQNVTGLIDRQYSKGPSWHFVTYLVAHALVILVCGIITEVTKRLVGRLRPDFLSRCIPVLASAISSKIPAVTTIYYNQTICTGDPKIIAEGRLSFPSGHSSSSFAGLGLLALWLFAILKPLPFYILQSRNLPLSTGHGLRVVIAFLPLFAAVCIAITRTEQNVHNPTDVIGGGIIGFLTALLFWWLYFYNDLQYANKLERKNNELELPLVQPSVEPEEWRQSSSK